jgi:hypothetical protein
VGSLTSAQPCRVARLVRRLAIDIRSFATSPFLETDVFDRRQGDATRPVHRFFDAFAAAKLS